MKDAFARIDTNGDGGMDREELYKGMCDIGIIVLPAEIDMLFERFDDQGDGKIDYHEFLNFMGYGLKR